MNLDFTFLTAEQIFGDNKLKIFEHYGTKAAITDFAILLGGFVNMNNSILEDRTGFYWTSSDTESNFIGIVGTDGEKKLSVVNKRDYGARLALTYSSICSISSNKVRVGDDLLEVEYGEYPQKVASERLQNELENAYKVNNSFYIEKTGKTYITDSKRHKEYKEFKAQIIDEYLFFNNGKKYVRVKANSREDWFVLSNGEKYKHGDYVWVEVSPIKWLVDEENDISISERILFAGVQFNHERNYKGDFQNTTIKKFIDECFSKDIIVNYKRKNDESVIDVIINCLVDNNKTEINKENMSIDDIINETLFKMNEILGEETQKVFTKVKK